MNGLDSYKLHSEIDESMLLKMIQVEINLFTVAGSSDLKDKLEMATLSDHNQGIKNYIDWYVNAEKKLRGLGVESYDEHLRNIFRTFETCENADFCAMILPEKRKLMQGERLTTSNYRSLLNEGKLLFQNIGAINEWKLVQRSTTKTVEAPQYLTMKSMV